MKVITSLFQNNLFVKEENKENLLHEEAQLVVAFGSGSILKKSSCIEKIQLRYPNATICSCSTAGEILGIEVFDETVSIVALQFEKAYTKAVSLNINTEILSYEAGKKLVSMLPKEDLKLIYVISDGTKVNGSELVKGLNFEKPKDLLITGGLAGDGTHFKETFVGLNEIPQPGNIVAIGFYGDSLQVSSSSFGGWDSFGLEREVTKATSNVLCEIDHKNALDLYKKYLGKHADELPAAALLFPLAINKSADEVIVRTILSIDEEAKTMTFAGDIPEGSKVRFMKANFDKLIDAASDAATNCLKSTNKVPKLTLLVSCVGRKMILGNRIDEEIEAISEIFEDKSALAGFYSYGEIAPLENYSNCELHNQTMTITCIDEIV